MAPTPRDDRPLPDDSLVLRGGRMVISDLRRNAIATLQRMGRLGVSVRAGRGADIEELAENPFPLPHAVIRVTTVGRLRAAGFEIEATGAYAHCTVWLPDATHERLEHLRAAFDDPAPNPAAGE